VRTIALWDDVGIDPMRWLLIPYEDAAAHLLAAAEAILEGARTRRVLGSLLLSVFGAFYLYVPVHELLHALGCRATGGRVTTLLIAPFYGGGLLARILPFVHAGGEHAGKLSDFDTGKSDFVYLCTDLAPYLLSLGSFSILRSARRRRSALLFGLGAVLVAAPLMGLIGDYFEMAGILASRALVGIGAVADDNVVRALRSDDLPALLAGFDVAFPRHRAAWAAAVAGTFVVDVLLVTTTLAIARLRRAGSVD
jgi:hypothetical protein